MTKLLKMSLVSARRGTTGENKKRPLVFGLNGRIVQIEPEEVDPTMTVNEYLRRHTPFKGTKIACGEGGCGACTVMLSKEIDGVVSSTTVNSCLRPLVTCNGLNITTIEGIGNQRDGFHPIQERLAAFNGTQCGFCSPGMVMSMYGNLKAVGGEGGKGVTMAQVEGFLDGNLCRCTGYRPILDAFKSFAADSNITDQVCGNASLGPYDDSKDPEFPAGLRGFVQTHLQFNKNGVRYIRPTSGLLAHACYTFWAARGPTRLVAGNTSVGVYKDRKVDTLVDLSLLGLDAVTATDGGLEVGALASLTALSNALEANEARSVSFGPIASHIRKIANTHVRNAGTVAGNLCMARNIGFKSDLAPVLSAAGARVTYRAGPRGKLFRDEPLAEWVTSKENEAFLLTKVFIPFQNKASDVFMSYKVANRPQNSEAYVNAAFHLQFASGAVQSLVACFGGIQPEDVPFEKSIRALNTEKFVVGKPLSSDTLKGAIDVLQAEMVPSVHSEWHQGQHDPAANAHYRRTLVATLLHKFFVFAATKFGLSVDKKVLSAGLHGFDRPVTTASQAFERLQDEGPVPGKAVQKIEGRLQTSGELPYTDDLPTVTGTIYCVYLHSQAARGTVKGFDTSAAEAIPGFIRLILGKDVPKANVIGMPSFGIPDSPLISSDVVTFYGQIIGLVVATTEKIARAAAQAIVVTIDEEPPCISLQPYFKSGKLDEIPKHTFIPIKHVVACGDAAAALAKAGRVVAGNVEMGTQKHFYLEAQTAYVIPDEDGSLTVNCSVQGPGLTAESISRTVGIPQNRIQIIHRRSGGSFGGKATAAAVAAVTCSVAAYLTKQPVRLLLSRAEDFETAGGREENYCKYEAAYNENGVLDAVKHFTIQNGGQGFDAAMMGFLMNRSFHEAYKIPSYDGIVQLYRTNTVRRSFVRGPGELSASYCMETILEHIAHDLDIDPVLVRERNLYPEDDEKLTPSGGKLEYYTVPQMWFELKKKVDYDGRKAAIDLFNKENRWRKRGISITPVNYHVQAGSKQASVALYTDGTVLLSSGGSEMGQGLTTKATQVASRALGALLGRPLAWSDIRFQPTNSYNVPNASVTGGSTGSEAVCAAMQLACDALVERLKPVVDLLRAEAAKKAEAGGAAGDAAPVPEVTFEQLVKKANAMNITLAQVSRWGGGGANGEGFGYNNYGVACSEVELDALTGESVIIRTDLTYDCGKSLNPAIDVGQCEGAFMMGVGHLLREREVMSNSGKILSEGTWLYKIPSVMDVPLTFNIELLQNHAFDKGILSSKASGEPPLVLAASVIMAVRQAIKACRFDAGNREWFELAIPATPDVIQNACAVTNQELVL